MSEWLIIDRDKAKERGFADKYLDPKCYERGDVIVVCPDGWPWSKLERTTPEWRILKMPGVSVATAEAFLGPEFDTDAKNPSPFLRRRAFKLDVDSLTFEKTVLDWLAEGSKNVPPNEDPKGDPNGDSAKAIALDEQQVLALKIAKQPIKE